MDREGLSQMSWCSSGPKGALRLANRSSIWTSPAESLPILSAGLGQALLSYLTSFFGYQSRTSSMLSKRSAAKPHPSPEHCLKSEFVLVCSSSVGR